MPLEAHRSDSQPLRGFGRGEQRALLTPSAFGRSSRHTWGVSAARFAHFLLTPAPSPGGSM